MSETMIEPDDADEQGDQTAAGTPSPADQPDGGPGSHTEDGTGGTSNDPASGGVPEESEAG